jgi:hypothetical protein
MEIETEAEESEGGVIFSGDGFNEEASEFSILQKKIVGPFEGGLELGEGADGIGGGEGTEQGKERKMGRGDFEKKGDPEAEGSVGEPRFAGATVAGSLDFGYEDGGWGGERAPEVILSGGEGGDDGNAVAEWGGGGEKEVDLSGLEGVGRVLPRGGIRERNCRRS